MASQESRLIISIDARNAERQARELSRELDNITRNGGRASSQANVLGSSLRSLATSMAGVVTIGSAISKMDAYTGLQNRLKLVTSSQIELNTAMSDTFAIAQKTASSWDSVAMVYQRFADNADRLGISMKQTAALTETVSKAISVSGGSAASAEAALMQFGQALASGVLRGEEFNSIAEQAPGLLKAIAMGMDTNVGSLRAMAAEGKITGDELVKALSKAKPYIDDLFNKTDFTIAQSFTQLSNEVTKFVGAAGAGSGAAAGLSAAISGLANNLSTIADIAVVGGVALLTKTIAAQTVAIYGSITGVIARRAAELLALQTQVQLAGLEVQRTRQVAALALTELNLARQELNSATTRQARAAATMRLTQAEIALALAEKQKTAATIADTAAQNANNAARSRGAMLLGAIGGPIGAITIGVAALAAGYMYLKSRTDEANAKLEEQGQIASKTSEELEKLVGNDKISAVNDLTAAFNAQNETLAKSKESVDAVLFAIRAASVENERARKITEDAKNGVISYTDAIKLLNNEKISVELYNKLKDQADQYDENSKKAGNTQKALAALKVNVDLTGNAMQNAANKTLNNANAMDTAANSAANLAAKLAGITSNLQTEVFNAKLQAAFEGQGKSAKSAARWVETYTQNAKAGFKGVNLEQKKYLDQLDAEDKKQEARLNAQKAALSATKKSSSAAASQAKKDAKEAERLAEEIASIREQITYEYADREKQIEINLQKELADIRKAGMGSGYEERAKARANAEKAIYVQQLDFELDEYKMTEQEKIIARYNINQKLLLLDQQLTAKDLARKSKALKEKTQLELAQAELSKQQRIHSAREQFLDTTYAMQERYRLERAEIQLINGELERNFRLEMSRLAESTEARKRLMDAQTAWAATQAQMNGTSEYQGTFDTQNSRMTESQELFDAQIAMANSAEERLAIWQAYQDRLTQIEQAGAQARRDLTFTYAQSMVGGYTDMFKDMMGEQSTAYKAMFAVQKAFALAQVLLNAPESYSKAYNAMVGIPYIGPVVAPAAGIAAVALQLAQAAQIKSVNLGFKTGGYTGNGGTSDVAGVVHGQEYVLNAAATKRVGVDTLNAVNRGGSLDSGVNITINNNVNADVMATQNSDGSVTIDIVERKIQESWGRVRNANSNESRVIQQSFGMQPAR